MHGYRTMPSGTSAAAGTSTADGTAAARMVGEVEFRSSQQWLARAEQTNAPPAQDVGSAEAELERLAAQLLGRDRTRYERLMKPAMDRAASAVLVFVLSPVMLLAALTLLITMGTPVLLRQTRVGQDRQPFSMFKFRTMLPDRRVGLRSYIGPERRRTHKSADDPRHTRVGRLMRKLSIDELPQLFNVLRGDMSLVGPRPELYDLIGCFCEWQDTRHLVKPGVTGVWQTTARGHGRPLHECVDLDLYYIAELSFRHDLAILARTPAALLRNRSVI
jgi:lipopolysaccharide/colanic/teichoic acid biosynthesis glycosyltransferase